MERESGSKDRRRDFAVEKTARILRDEQDEALEHKVPCGRGKDL